ncbi:hypothetical protein CBOM_02645 [Ceraceosorus bombacis]|uniref:Uncharacterized protein n=1 Tax=Ceraceosorus bombacis TaxID=401625 RepID=A0A0P1BF36_9BASI|nr:hypothetical protein CBOM_02645 [Ceraceosorus bombacis]
MTADIARDFMLTCPRAALHVPIGPRPKHLASHINKKFPGAQAQAGDNDHSSQKNWVQFVSFVNSELQCQRPVLLLLAYSNTLMHYVTIVASRGGEEVVVLDTNSQTYAYAWEDLHHMADKKGTHLAHLRILSNYNWISFGTKSTRFDRILGNINAACCETFYNTVYHIDWKDHFYMLGQQESRVGSPWCHPGFYRARYPKDADALGPNNIVEHMLTVGLSTGRQLSPHFDPGYYWDAHEDLRNAFHDRAAGRTRNEALLAHWIRHGLDEGRRAAKDMCFRSYLERYKDLQDAFGPTAYKRAAMHWYEHGINEGRSSAPL